MFSITTEPYIPQQLVFTAQKSFGLVFKDLWATDDWDSANIRTDTDI
jgi:hypothetical protein